MTLTAPIDLKRRLGYSHLVFGSGAEVRWSAGIAEGRNFLSTAAPKPSRATVIPPWPPRKSCLRPVTSRDTSTGRQRSFRRRRVPRFVEPFQRSRRPCLRRRGPMSGRARSRRSPLRGSELDRNLCPYRGRRYPLYLTSARLTDTGSFPDPMRGRPGATTRSRHPYP